MSEPSRADEDPITTAFHELFAGLERRAPGSETSTLRALARVPQPESRRSVIELGSGSGCATLPLAAALPEAHILAVDLDADAIAMLRERATRAGVAARIDARVADMRELGNEARDADLIWAEGSLYAVEPGGLSEGLGLCRRLLAPDGIVALTELIWLREANGARAFWAEAYPHMRTREGVEAELRVQGFEPLADFVLPRADWDAYYGPLRARLDRFAAGEQPGMQEAIALLRAEIDIFDRFGDEFGYGFWLARPRPA